MKSASPIFIFNKNRFKELIKYNLGNRFVKFGSLVFEYTISISVKSDSAQFLADLFLHYYERKWVHEKYREDLLKCFSFQ